MNPIAIALIFGMAAALPAAALIVMCFVLPTVLIFAAVAYDREPTVAIAEPDLDDRADAARLTRGRKRALIVGAGAVGQTLARNLEAGGRYEVVGFADEADESEEWVGPILGSRDQTMDLIRRHRIDEVFVAYAPSWQQRLAQDLAAERPHVRVQIVPSAYEALIRVDSVSSMGDIAVLRLNAETISLFDVLKRLVDVVAALLGGILLIPLGLLVALLVKLTSRGPMIFAQERVGQCGRAFILYKFRTMVQDAEACTGPVLSNGRRDERVTRLGRFLRATRLDELPQLWNVIRGDMSLVGPRPERPHFVRRFEREIPSYGQRHLVRPGITGLAQVHGNYHTDARDKLRFDLIYVAHRSILLDINILLRTVLVVFSSRGS